MNVTRGASTLTGRQKWISQLANSVCIFFQPIFTILLFNLLLATKADSARLFFDLLFKLLHPQAEPTKGLALCLFCCSSQIFTSTLHEGREGSRSRFIIYWLVVAPRDLTLSVSLTSKTLVIYSAGFAWFELFQVVGVIFGCLIRL